MTRATGKREETPKPCPFCGRDPKVDECGRTGDVSCRSQRCIIGNMGLWFTVKEWNRRAAPPAGATGLTREDETLLVNIAQLMDAWKESAPAEWTEYDQGLRDGLSLTIQRLAPMGEGK